MNVYEPAEDSFLLLEYIEEKDLQGLKCLDMGTGSGILAVEMARKGGEVVAVDVDSRALEQARERAVEAGVEDSICFIESDLFGSIEGEFDFIVFNPPYLPGEREEEDSLVGGREGVELTLEFLEQCGEYLSEGGEAAFIASDRSNLEEFEGFAVEVVESKELWFEELRVYRTEASFL